jgi:hypothetical protein
MVTKPIGAYFAKVDAAVTTGIPSKSSGKNTVQPNSSGGHSRHREIAEHAQPVA